MRPEFSVSQLRHFLLVADTGSFHAAAERAHRTQPAVSLSIRELERRLGGALFERGRQGSLTPLGERCLPLARELLEHYEHAVDEMTRFAESRSGTVSVAAVPSIAGRLLPGPLARFAERHPDVRLRLFDANSHDVQRMVQRARVDFGLTSVWESAEDLAFEPLLQDRVGLVCHRDHPLAAAGPELPWEALRGHRHMHNGTTRLVYGTPAESVVADSHIAVPNMISLIAMLESGAGITTLPRLAFPTESETLRFVELVEPRIQRTLGILQPAGRSLSPAAAGLRDDLAAALRARSSSVEADPGGANGGRPL